MNKGFVNEKVHPIIASALCKRSNNEIIKIINFIEQKRKACKQEVEFINFEAMSNWSQCKSTGNLQHSSRKFFSIIGLDVYYEHGIINNWQQPIINQAEIGILGIVCKKIDGVLHFLLQLKAEPGNIGKLQLSPTLQATKSNFMKVHEGKTPKFLEYFKNNQKYKTIVNVLQSEQGSRFLKKQNQNIIIEINDHVESYENFIWLTLGQIFELMKYDNLVNMDTRTVISCIPYHDLYMNQSDVDSITNNQSSHNICPVKLHITKSLFERDSSINSSNEIITWFTNQKVKHQLSSNIIPLKHVREWNISSSTISNVNETYFKVKACRVSSPGREVQSWDQPIIQPRFNGLIVLFTKRINGVYHFLIQAKAEPGVIDNVEIAATIQCITGNYENIPNKHWPKYLDYFKSNSKYKIIYDTMQSEEGGRFYQESNRNIVIEVPKDFWVEDDQSHIWVTLKQMKNFIQYNNFVNIQCRSLISCLGLF